MKNLDPQIVKVAIADDHALFRAGVKTALSSRKDIQMIAEAENGMQLLNLLKHIKPDVILLDIQMPIMDGFEASSLIRDFESSRGLARTPIIALTANALKEDKDRCFEVGMDDYLSKPVRPESLDSVLAKWSRRKAA